MPVRRWAASAMTEPAPTLRCCLAWGKVRKCHARPDASCNEIDGVACGVRIAWMATMRQPPADTPQGCAGYS